MAEAVRGFRCLGESVVRLVEIGSAVGCVVDAAGDREGALATFGLVIEVASS